jgi:hypothetical protein
LQPLLSHSQAEIRCFSSLFVPIPPRETHCQAEFDKAFRLGLSEGRGGGFSACARECEAEAVRRFDAALQDALVQGVPELNGGRAGALRRACGALGGTKGSLKVLHGRG